MLTFCYYFFYSDIRVRFVPIQSVSVYHTMSVYLSEYLPNSFRVRALSVQFPSLHLYGSFLFNLLDSVYHTMSVCLSVCPSIFRTVSESNSLSSNAKNLSQYISICTSDLRQLSDWQMKKKYSFQFTCIIGFRILNVNDSYNKNKLKIRNKIPSILR